MSKKFDRELLADVAERLISHLQTRTDVQNIDLMNLSGFCRNCLSKWFLKATNDRGVEMNYGEARQMIYGMPYESWQAENQKQASEEQKRIFLETKPLHAKISGHN